MPRIAIMYDFDNTLSTRDMQEYGYIPSLGMEPKDFWEQVNQQTIDNQMDQISSYLYFMIKKAKEKNIHLTKKYLNDLGKGIELLPGVEEWFERVNEYGRKAGIEVEHYIISSGLKEIIMGSKIAGEFKEVYASSYHYDQDDNPDWPSTAVNYTNKTQFFFRIHKGVLDISDDSINKAGNVSSTYVPYSNMIYVGDGLTDVPCMTITKQFGGYSIAVYTEKNKNIAKVLLDEDRVNFTALADYSKDSDMDKLIQSIIEKAALNSKRYHLEKDMAKYQEKQNDFLEK